MNGETVLHQPLDRIPWLQIFILTAGAFMAFMDVSIVTVAMPKLMFTFGVGIDSIQWISTAYLLSAGVTIPVVGYFSDRLGIKTAFLVAVGIFTVGSALCSVAASENFLIAARVVQAVGGGAIMPVSTAYIYQIVPRNKIGQAVGTRGIAVAAAPAFGPALGGYIIDRLNWHIIFTINLPIGVLTILLGMMLLPRIASYEKPHLDLPGMALITAGAFLILLGLSRGQSVGWHSLSIVTELTTGVFALIIFVLWELSTDYPVIDLRVFQGNRVLTASFLGIFLVTIALYGAIFLLPIYVQETLGFTPLQTGLLMTPAAIGMGISMPLAGRLFDRIGAVPLCVIGILLAAATTFQLSHLAVDTSYRTIEIWYFERSAGFPLLMLPMTVAGLNTVSRKVMSRVTSFQSLVRQLAGALGIAFLTYLYDRKQVTSSALYRDKLSPSSPAVTRFVHGASGFFSSHTGLGSHAARILALSALDLDVAHHATTMAVDYTMAFSALIILVILPVVFFLRAPKTAEAHPDGPPGHHPPETAAGKPAPAAR